MANSSAAKLRRKDKRSKSPQPPSSNSNTKNDERSLPDRLEALVLTSLTAPISGAAALSASSLTPNPPRRLTPTPPIKSTGLDKPMPTSFRPVHLLIASLGNPAPYHNTRHSAGHLLLKVLASRLGAPALHNSREYGGLVSTTTTDQGTSWTLFQSPSQMNISGPPLLKAFKAFSSQLPKTDDYDRGLVILHDELELDPGKTKVKKGDSSAKGHNGIKSVQASLQGAGLLGSIGPRFIKVGVGIGRPVSRDRDDVSSYVLGQLTGAERVKIEGAAEGLMGLLMKEAEMMGK